MLEIRNLACTRGDHLLFFDLNFTLNAGEILQVQGVNGSGKTTLLRTLCGLVTPTAGQINWSGRNIQSLGAEYYAEMIYLGHLNALKDELSAVENMRISAGLAGCEIDDVQIFAALQHMGLRGRETLPVKALSQGQSRRVALARLLIGHFPLWILDEPLTALDVGAVQLIQDLIAAHLARNGMVIYTTHQPLEVVGVTTRRLTLS
ncbi:MAG: cytochrome c biogenesis heme-transporting ATPase CcmA [Candidatus Nitrotoga sp.]